MNSSKSWTPPGGCPLDVSWEPTWRLFYLRAAADEEHQDWQQIFESNVLYWKLKTARRKPDCLYLWRWFESKCVSDSNNPVSKRKTPLFSSGNRHVTLWRCLTTLVHTPERQTQPAFLKDVQNPAWCLLAAVSAQGHPGELPSILCTHTDLLLRLNSSFLQDKCGL